MSKGILRVGTISGRHTMPAEYYLIDRSTQPGQPAYDKAYNAMCALVRKHKPRLVELYYTGLSEVIIGALDALRNMRVEHVIMRYDLKEDSYFPIERIIPPARRKKS